MGLTDAEKAKADGKEEEMMMEEEMDEEEGMEMEDEMMTLFHF